MSTELPTPDFTSEAKLLDYIRQCGIKGRIFTLEDLIKESGLSPRKVRKKVIPLLGDVIHQVTKRGFVADWDPQNTSEIIEEFNDRSRVTPIPGRMRVVTLDEIAQLRLKEVRND